MRSKQQNYVACEVHTAVVGVVLFSLTHSSLCTLVFPLMNAFMWLPVLWDSVCAAALELGNDGL